MRRITFYLTKERAEKYDHSGEPTGISDLRLIVRNDENDIHNLQRSRQR
ncbi:hypothetical protein LNP26_19115 [Klebsiella variicola subsp. variicola]|nr:hypothetical protein [Klebsiella variicola subsp. variicola]